eukprot:PhM_4_TR12920/c0_g1_i2/m.2478
MHFVFGSISYDRAFDWSRRTEAGRQLIGISLDMRHTHSDDESGSFDCCFLSAFRVVELVEITLPSTVSATCLGDHFLRNCRNLTCFDTSPLKNVTKIGRDFLAYCEALTTLDLAPLSNVSEIGENFLRHCKALTALDLTPLTSVTTIGFDFLSGCKSLSSVDLSTFSNVTVIGDY